MFACVFEKDTGHDPSIVNCLGYMLDRQECFQRDEELKFPSLALFCKIVSPMTCFGYQVKSTCN